MADVQSIYLVISGASSARVTPDLIRSLAQFDLPIYTFLTAGAHNIISPYNLADQQGHTLVEGYFDPVLMDQRDPGLTLVAPATFNTVNKISQGIADTLPHSLVAEAIGAGWPVIVVPALNAALANHPQFRQSIETLRAWGVTVLDSHMDKELLMMAPIDEIIAAIKAVL
jgi:phosphopantothenoylcysteine synthetase/decarboxylase